MAKLNSGGEAAPNALELATQSNKCAGYIERFRSHWKASAASYIALSETVKEAEDKLSKADLRVFHETVGLDPKGSTYRKLLKIAEAADWLRANIEKLPSSWTTIYELAKRKPKERKALLEAGVVQPTLTAEELATTLNKPAKTVTIKTSAKPSAKPANTATNDMKETQPEAEPEEVVSVSVAPATAEAPKMSAADIIVVPDPERQAIDDLGPVHGEAVLIDLRHTTDDYRCSLVGALRAMKRQYGFEFVLGTTIQRLWDEAGTETQRPRVPEGFVQCDYVAALKQNA